MISLLKTVLKKNPLAAGAARRVRNFFLPHYRLFDLAGAWNLHFYFEGDLDGCLALYRKNRAFKDRLARRLLEQKGSVRKFLGPEWAANIGTLAHLDTYVKIGLLGWRDPSEEGTLTAYPHLIGNRFLLDLWK